MHNCNLAVFSGSETKILSQRIVKHLDRDLSKSNTEKFPDGEIIVKIEENVRDKECFVILSTSQPVNDNLMELFIFIDCLKRASANRIICVIPYFGYGRQDRKDQGRVPITAKLVANLVTSAGADRVVTLDLHSAQIEGFFDIPVDHLHAAPVFSEYFSKKREDLGDLVMVSPDVGNVKVAEGYANNLDADIAIINKKRKSGSEIEMGQIIGNVNNKNVIMFDDMISTGGTICKAAKLVKEKGAKKVIAAATHPLFSGSAMDNLSEDVIDQIVCTDTIMSGNRVDVHDRIGHKYTELSVSSLIAKAIWRIYNRQSVSELFGSAGFGKR